MPSISNDLVIIVGADDRYIFGTAVLNGGAYGRRQVGGDIKSCLPNCFKNPFGYFVSRYRIVNTGVFTKASERYSLIFSWK